MKMEEGFEGLQIDEGIADILKRLKSAKMSNITVEKYSSKNENIDISNDLEVPAEDVEVSEAPKVVSNNEQADQFGDIDLPSEEILPWFTTADKDIKLVHYIKFDDSGNITYNTIKAASPDEDLAALRIRPDYVCDIDYYKSRHFVLCVKQVDSDYHYSRSYIPTDESYTTNDSNIVVEDIQITSEDNSTSSNPALEKVPTESVLDIISSADKYHHYIVFTDLGIADFIVRQDDLSYPFGESNFSKWFEETSNYVPLHQAKFEVNSCHLSNAVNSIKDFKYDIITMHRPGFITLDSIDNDDPSYSVTIKLKDEFNFIPMNRILSCLRYYASHTNKSTDDLRRMINKYFDVII